VDDLTAFVRARLDEDEAAALAAGGGVHCQEWDALPAGHQESCVEDGHGDGVVGPYEGSPTLAQARHIARHDPGRALREVEAKRDILTAYIKTEAGGYRGEGWIAFRFAVETLAMVWSDHPDCRPEWKP